MRAFVEKWLHAQWAKRGLWSLLMRPLAAATHYYVHHKARRAPAKASKQSPPVIVVGNILVGGAGKTPVVLALCSYLKAQGWQPGIISRGYGVKIRGAAQVGQGKVAAAEFGDEPSLLAQQSGVPIAVHPKRLQALNALCAHYPQTNVVIADDGLQHYALPRSIEIVVQDQRGVGNGLLLPAGPLREPPARLSQVDWIITQTAPKAAYDPPTANSSGSMAKQVHMYLWPCVFEQLSSGQTLSTSQWLQCYQGQSGAALAAIGQPQRFFAMLKSAGVQLERCIAQADHQRIAASTFSQLTQPFILITAKDAVKYPTCTDPRIWVVHVNAVFTPPTWLQQLEQQLGTLSY